MDKNVKKEIVCYQIFLSSSVCLEYVNQEIQDLRPGIPDRPSTLPRKAKPERRLPNGLSSGHSVENPGYLIPAGASTSPAFDNPYYLDLVAKAKAVAGTAAVDGPEAAERDGGVPRHVNGFVTPTAENPEYLGLADTWSGYTWGEGVWVMWWTREESQIVFNWGKMNVCVTMSDDGNSMCTQIQTGGGCPADHPVVTHHDSTQCSINLVSVASFVFLSSSQLSMWLLSAKKEVLSAFLYITQYLINKGVPHHGGRRVSLSQNRLTGLMNADFFFFFVHFLLICWISVVVFFNMWSIFCYPPQFPCASRYAKKRENI